MKLHFSCLAFLFLFLLSCNNHADKRIAENVKEAKKKELVFLTINNAWSFNIPNINTNTLKEVNNWNEWRLLVNELYEKPKTTIGAFQKKAKALSKRIADLNNNIPPPFFKPEIKSRIAVLTNKINSINLFINLDAIPAQKVVVLVADVNIELVSLSQQMEEIIRKSNIPKEEGESDMIKMLDTSRAIPTIQTKPIYQKIE